MEQPVWRRSLADGAAQAWAGVKHRQRSLCPIMARNQALLSTVPRFAAVSRPATLCRWVLSWNEVPQKHSHASCTSHASPSCMSCHPASSHNPLLMNVVPLFCLPCAQEMNVLGMQGRGRERHPGVITSALAPSKCIACGQCAVICPVSETGWRVLAVLLMA